MHRQHCTMSVAAALVERTRCCVRRVLPRPAFVVHVLQSLPDFGLVCTHLPRPWLRILFGFCDVTSLAGGFYRAVHTVRSGGLLFLFWFEGRLVIRVLGSMRQCRGNAEGRDQKGGGMQPVCSRASCLGVGRTGVALGPLLLSSVTCLFWKIFFCGVPTL